jgi:hypothetical protein
LRDARPGRRAGGRRTPLGPMRPSPWSCFPGLRLLRPVQDFEIRGNRFRDLVRSLPGGVVKGP